MGMYKSNISPEQEKARSNVESVDAFLARGGQIQSVKTAVAKLKRNKTAKPNNGMIDAQKLLDDAIKAGCAEEAIKFLKEQGIEVQ
jgi:hypothetical protein